jgi:hypothetical protein
MCFLSSLVGPENVSSAAGANPRPPWPNIVYGMPFAGLQRPFYWVSPFPLPSTGD